MGSVRITQGILVSRTLSNIARQMQRVGEYQERLGTGLRVNTPSDDPLEARRAITTRVLIGKNEQYINNIQAVDPQLLEPATSVHAVVDMIHRARELTLQGATGTNAQPQRDSLAMEISQLLESVLAEANHQTDGRYIFAGSRTLGEAFTAVRDVDGQIVSVAYNGNNVVSKVAVSEGITLDVNVPGDEVFQGTTDIFQTLIGIRDDLLAGNQNNLNTIHLDNLSTSLDQLLQIEARVGSVQNRADRLTHDMENAVLRLQELLSHSIDAEYSDTIIKLNAHSNALTSAMQAGARVLQPSLLDFVR